MRCPKDSSYGKDTASYCLHSRYGACACTRASAVAIARRILQMQSRILPRWALRHRWRHRHRMPQRVARTNGELKEYGEKLPTWDKWDQIKDDYNDWESRATVEHGVEVKEPRKVYDQVLKVETVIQPGIYTDYSIIFIRNQNNIWKIESF